ncbi:MAG: glycosyltransferase family 39 protein [Methylomonas sp.]
MHPPLYQLLLNAWIHVFGDSEISTRSLSMLFAFLTIIVIFVKGKKVLSDNVVYLAITIISTNYFFAVYAQETRSYAMMMFLSSSLTLQYINIINQDFSIKNTVLLCFTAIILSLTHYFGLIYSGIILIFSLVQSRGNLTRSFIIISSGISLLIWPIFHFVYGTLFSKAGGSFWITSNGPQSTIWYFFDAVLPILNRMLLKIENHEAVEIVLAVIIVTFILIVNIKLLFDKSKYGQQYKGSQNISFSLILVLTAFIILLMIVDKFSPISTARNYIVILPITAILAATFLLKYIKTPVLLLVLCYAYATANSILAYRMVKTKIAPAQNNIVASDIFLKLIHECPSCSTYFAVEDLTPEQDLPFRFNEAVFYLLKDGILAADLPKALRCNKLNELKPPFIVYMQYCGTNKMEVLKEFTQRKGNEILKPIQGYPESVLVLYSKLY